MALKELFGAISQNGANLFEDGAESLVNGTKRIEAKSLTKDYLAGRFSTHVHLFLRIPLKHFDSKEFCAIFHRCPEFGVHHYSKPDSANRVSHFVVREENTNFTHRVWPIDNGNNSKWQYAMFVGIVKFMKKPQGMSQNIIPSMIWLQPLNKCIHRGGEVSNTFKAIFTIKRWSSEDGEFRLAVRGRRSGESELPSHMVEQATEFVKNISDNNSPLQGRSFQNFDFENYLTGLLIRFGNHSTRVRVVKPLDSIIQGIEMFNCPTEFEITAIKRMHHIISHTNEEI